MVAVRHLAAVAAAGAAFAGTPAGGDAARPPTHAEREAITRALPQDIRAIPVGCLRLDLRVSRNPRFAYVGLEFLNTLAPRSRCLRYASNGFFVLRKSPAWRIVYDGSDRPPCSLAIPRDLVACRPA